MLGLNAVDVPRMADEKPPYYIVRYGRGRCAPSPKMQRHGFAGLQCGPDGPQARSMAWEWYKRWLEFNKKLKVPSSNSESSGQIIFIRTSTHVDIRYMPERSGNLILPHLSAGEGFSSIVIVRGNRGDENYLLERLAPYRTKIGFSLSDDVLLEIRSAVRAQKIVRSAEEEMTRQATTTSAPVLLEGETGAYTTDVTDDQWRAITAILKAKTPENPKPRMPKRETINAIIHHLRSGRPWAKLPDHMPHHEKVRVTYVSLVERNKWEKIEAVLNVRMGRSS